MKARLLKSFVLSLFFCVFFFVSYLHTPRGNYYTNYSLNQVLDVAKNDQQVVIYFARDDCSDCKLVDQKLVKANGHLRKTVYRIETRNEPDQEAIKNILNENNIQKVPTFLFVRRKTTIKIEALF